MGHLEDRAQRMRIRTALILAALAFWLVWPLVGEGYGLLTAVVVGLVTLALVDEVTQALLR